jgi:hypothetical protein
MTERVLPEAFSQLEHWVERWALDTQNARETARRASTSADLQAFYDAMVGQMDAIIAHLNTFPLTGMPLPQARLFYLTLSLAEVAPHVELYRGDPRVPYSFEEERFVAEHGAVPNYLGNIYASA